MNSIIVCVIVVICIIVGSNSQEELPLCNPSVTTVTGTHAPKGQICSGQLILNEEFHQFNHELWKNEIAMGGGGVNLLHFFHNQNVNVTKTN